MTNWVRPTSDEENERNTRISEAHLLRARAYLEDTDADRAEERAQFELQMQEAMRQYEIARNRWLLEGRKEQP